MLVARPVDSDDREAARRLALSRMTLDGRDVDATVGDALQDAPWERTIEGASTLTLQLLDPDGDLLDSGLFHYADEKGRRRVRPVEVEVAMEDPTRPLGFRLVRVQWAFPTLNLTFEDREVALLRAHTRPRKASRAKVTMAEFALMLVREVKVERIRFVCPELHKRQPIGSRRDIETVQEKNEKRTEGFGEGAAIEVKGKPAERAQVRVLEQILDTCMSRDATRRVMIGAVMCTTQEATARNLRGGDRDSRGAFQQRPNGAWPASRDVPRDTNGFLDVALGVFKAHPERSIGWCVDQTQRSYTFGTAGQGRDYDQWREEAEATVDTYLGSSSAGGGGRPGGQYVKRYEFRRGEPGGERENTWDCIGRLADERRWRRFMDRGVFHLASDNYLRRARSRLKLRRGDLPASVLEVRVSDADVGKTVAEMEVDAFVEQWVPPIGSTAEFEGYGPADEKYLLASVRGNLFSPKCTARYVVPVPKLPEPLSEVGQRAGDTSGGERGSLSGTKIADAYAKAKQITAKKYPYVWGGGHAHMGRPDGGTAGRGVGYDCSGSVAAVLEAGGMAPDSWKSGVPASGSMATSWGEPGKGKWLTVYANSVHVFIVFHDVGGKGDEHFGTGKWGVPYGGAGLKPKMHPTAGFTARHWEPQQTAPRKLPEGTTGEIRDAADNLTRPRITGGIGGGDF